MKHSKLLSAALLMLFLYSLPSFGVVLDVRNGVLHGAKEVLVGSTLYDVSFQDGTCFDLFSGCDERTDFTFEEERSFGNPNVDGAILANSALLDQVFIDSAAGLFDSNPSLTNGCENPFSFCSVFTVTHTRFSNGAPQIRGIGTDNHPAARDFADTVFLFGSGFGSNRTDFTNAPQSTFALWSLSTPAFAPATLYLFLIGLMGLGMVRRL